MCAKEKAIKSSEECEAAAEALGMIFWVAFDGEDDFPDCYKSTEYGRVFFNTASVTSTDGYPELYDVRPICRKGDTGSSVFIPKSKNLFRSNCMLHMGVLIKG